MANGSPPHKGSSLDIGGPQPIVEMVHLKSWIKQTAGNVSYENNNVSRIYQPSKYFNYFFIHVNILKSISLFKRCTKILVSLSHWFSYPPISKIKKDLIHLLPLEQQCRGNRRLSSRERVASVVESAWVTSSKRPRSRTEKLKNEERTSRSPPIIDFISQTKPNYIHWTCVSNLAIKRLSSHENERHLAPSLLTRGVYLYQRNAF